jgi:cephalosporin-C deacetylase-like acetyl esterase
VSHAQINFCRHLFWFAVAGLAQSTQPRPPQPPFKTSENIQVRDVDIVSDGTRMSGQLYSDRANAGKKLPAIVLAHGWGGVQASLRPEALAFAQAGYLALTFDYRGWGTS